MWQLGQVSEVKRAQNSYLPSEPGIDTQEKRSVELEWENNHVYPSYLGNGDSKRRRNRSIKHAFGTRDDFSERGQAVH
jgi:hypothetical protein